MKNDTRELKRLRMMRTVHPQREDGNYTTVEVVKILQVSHKTLKRWRDNGFLPAVHLETKGCANVYDRQDVQAIVQRFIVKASRTINKRITHAENEPASYPTWNQTPSNPTESDGQTRHRPRA